MDYSEAIKKLAQAQQVEKDLKKMIAPIQMQIDTMHNTVKALDEKIRAAALMDFLDGGEKPNHGAIDIQLRKQHSYGSVDNIVRAFDDHPEFLVVRADLFAAYALSICENMHAVLSLQVESEYTSSAKQLCMDLMKVLVVDEKALKEAHEQGVAPWARVTESVKPTVVISQKLGEYITE